MTPSKLHKTSSLRPKWPSATNSQFEPKRDSFSKSKHFIISFCSYCQYKRGWIYSPSMHSTRTNVEPILQSLYKRLNLLVQTQALQTDIELCSSAPFISRQKGGARRHLTPSTRKRWLCLWNTIDGSRSLLFINNFRYNCMNLGQQNRFWPNF